MRRPAGSAHRAVLSPHLRPRMALSAVFEEDPLHPVPLEKAVARTDREVDRLWKGCSIAASTQM